VAVIIAILGEIENMLKPGSHSFTVHQCTTNLTADLLTSKYVGIIFDDFSQKL
jgi:hypothetical protein